MVDNMPAVQARLEAENLVVRATSPDSLLIFLTAEGAGDMQVSQDASCLLKKPEGWVAVFPSKGMRAYEVPGSLTELLDLFLAVYACRKRCHQPLADAFSAVVENPAQYLRP